MRISYSALENFKQCPLKYKFSQIDKIREPKSKEAIFGTYIHKVLQWLYKKTPAFPTLNQWLVYYKEHWPQKSEGFAWLNKREEKFYFEEGQRMLKEYFQKNIPCSSSIIDLETHFEVVITEDSQQPDRIHILSGIIDRVDKLPDGTVEIIDYKTGKRMPSQNKVDKNNQLSLYAIGLKDRWPKLQLENLSLSLYFLKFGEKIKTKREERDLIAAKNGIIETIHQIKGSNFSPRSSPLCPWCGYRNICPIWRHLYEKHKEGDLNDLDIGKQIDEYFALQIQKEELEQKLQDIKSLIDVYSKQKGIDRIFGSNGYFERSISEEVSYDPEKVKKILEPLGKWKSVWAVDNEKLNKVLREIPLEFREKIKEIEKTEKKHHYLASNGKSKKDIKEEMIS